MPRNLSPTKQKLLLFLFSGLAIGFSYSPRKHFAIIKGMIKEWKKIDDKKLRREIRELYQSKLVDFKNEPDGSVLMKLTDKGKIKTLKYRFQDMRINRPTWDKKWRIVVFDIPEKLRSGRDALREKLKDLGFYELQKSVMVFPHDCKNEIEFIVEFFNLRRYARYGVLELIDNDFHLRKIFELD